MRIGYLVNTYPRASHSFIRREVHALERQGHHIHRFAMRSDRAALVDPADLAEDDRTEHLLKHPLRMAVSAIGWLARHPLRAAKALRMGRGLRHLVYMAEGAQIARRCKAEGITHLHAHFGTNSTTVAMLAHALGGPQFSFTTHGPEEFDAPVALDLPSKIRHAAFAVAISSFGRSQLCRWCEVADWPRLHVVHCGVEPDRFPDPAPVRGAPHFVAIGRLAEQKGFALLVEAMADVDATLTLVGDGPLRGQIEAAIAANGLGARVTLTGWADEARVRAELAAAHALVLPSFAEGLPMVVMEAMASGRPVIATTIAGVPELVTQDTGWLVPAGDAAALATALRHAASLPAKDLTRMGQAARDRVFARHDIDAEAAKLAVLFASYRPRTQPLVRPIRVASETAA